MRTSSARAAAARSFVALLVGLAVGCHDASGPTKSPPLESGQFRARFSGGVTGSLTGAAAHSQVDDWAEFRVDMRATAPGDNTRLVAELLLTHLGGQPGVGSYPVVPANASEQTPTTDSASFSLFVAAPRGDSVGGLDFVTNETHGSVRIDTATSLTYAGTVTLEGPARWMDGSRAGTVRVDATFRSKPFDWPLGRVAARPSLRRSPGRPTSGTSCARACP